MYQFLHTTDREAVRLTVVVAVDLRIVVVQVSVPSIASRLTGRPVVGVDGLIVERTRGIAVAPRERRINNHFTTPTVISQTIEY